MSHEAQIAKPIKHTVGLAGLEVTQDPEVVLCTLPLGAGLGVAIYDPISKVGGILHSALPTSSLNPRLAASHPGMFLDTGLQILFARARQLNALTGNLRLFAAGAAQIMDEAPEFNIGKTNCDSLGELLAQLGIGIVAQDVGGRHNCSLELVLATGEVRVNFCGQSEAKVLCRP